MCEYVANLCDAVKRWREDQTIVKVKQVIIQIL